MRHELMHNNFDKRDFIEVKKILNKKNPILTQSRKVEEFEKKMVQVVRSQIFNFC